MTEEMQQQQIIMELLQLVNTLDVPETPPTFARSGSPIGLSFLDSAISLDHVIRLSEEITLKDWRFLSRSLAMDISLDRLSEAQRDAGLLYGEYRTTPTNQIKKTTSPELELLSAAVRAGESPPGLIWTPVTLVDRATTAPVDLVDSDGRVVPRCTQVECLNLLDAAFYQLFRRLLDVRSSPSKELLQDFRYGRERRPRWLLQKAISHLIIHGRPAKTTYEIPDPKTIRGKAAEVVSGELRGSAFWAPFLQLLHLSSRNYLVVAGLPPRKTEHRLQYKLPDLPAKQRRLKFIPRRFGNEFEVSYVRSIPRSLDAYHLTLHAEEGVHVRRAVLTSNRDVDAVDLVTEDLAFLTEKAEQNLLPDPDTEHADTRLQATYQNQQIVDYELDRLNNRIEVILGRRRRDGRQVANAIRTRPKNLSSLAGRLQPYSEEASYTAEHGGGHGNIFKKVKHRYRLRKQAFRRRRLNRLQRIDKRRLAIFDPAPDAPARNPGSQKEALQNLAMEVKAYELGATTTVSDDARDNFAHVYLRKPESILSRDIGNLQIGLDGLLADIRPSLRNRVFAMSIAILGMVSFIFSSLYPPGYETLLGDKVGSVVNKILMTGTKETESLNILENSDGIIALVIVTLGVVFTTLEFPQTRTTLFRLQRSSILIAVANALVTIYMMISLASWREADDQLRARFMLSMKLYIFFIAIEFVLISFSYFLSKMSRLSTNHAPMWITPQRSIPRWIMTRPGLVSGWRRVFSDKPHILFDGRTSAIGGAEEHWPYEPNRPYAPNMLKQDTQRKPTKREDELDNINKQLNIRSIRSKDNKTKIDVKAIEDGQKISLVGVVPNLAEKIECESLVLEALGYSEYVDNRIQIKPARSSAFVSSVIAAFTLSIAACLLLLLLSGVGVTIAAIDFTGIMLGPKTVETNLLSISWRWYLGAVVLVGLLAFGLTFFYVRARTLNDSPSRWSISRAGELAREASMALAGRYTNRVIDVSYALPLKSDARDASLSSINSTDIREWGFSNGPCVGSVVASSRHNDPANTDERQLENSARYTFDANPAFLYGSARFIEVFIRISDNPRPSTLKEHYKLAQAIEGIAKEARNIQAAVLFMEAPASPPTDEGADSLRSPSCAGVRCRVAVPQTALLYRHRFRMKIAELAKKLGCECWIEDRRNSEARTWLKVVDRQATNEGGTSSCSSDESASLSVQSYLPITAIVEARTGATYRLVNYLMSIDTLPSSISMKAMADHAVIHLWIPCSFAPVEAGHYSAKVDEFPERYFIGQLDRADSPTLNPNPQLTTGDFETAVLEHFDAISYPEKTKSSCDGLVDNYRITIGPPTAPKKASPAEHNRVAIWCVWQIPASRTHHDQILEFLRESFEKSGSPHISINYGVCRQSRADRWLGRVKLSVDISTLRSEVATDAGNGSSDKDTTTQRRDPVIDLVDDLCRRVEATWLALLKGELGPSVDAHVTWRETSLGRWSSIR